MTPSKRIRGNLFGSDSATKSAYKSFTEIKNPYMKSGLKSRGGGSALKSPDMLSEEYDMPTTGINSSSRLAMLIND